MKQDFNFGNYIPIKPTTNEQGLAAVVAMTELMPGFIIVERCLSSHHSAKPNVLRCFPLCGGAIRK